MPNRDTTRILLVEDHEDSAFVTRIILERRGYSVRVAHQFHKAMALIAANRYDLLICDIMLPDGTGWELIRRAKALWPVKAIALSALTSQEDIATSVRAGFERHLTKPVSATDLLNTVEEVLTNGAVNPGGNGANGKSKTSGIAPP